MAEEQRTAGTMPPTYGSSNFLGGLITSIFGSGSNAASGNYGASRTNLTSPPVPGRKPNPPSVAADEFPQNSVLDRVFDFGVGIFDRAVDYVGAEQEYDRWLKQQRDQIALERERQKAYAQTAAPASGATQPVLASINPLMLVAMGLTAFLFMGKK